MNDAAAQLAAALRARLALISDEESRRQPGEHMEKLRAVSARIERLQGQLPLPLDPQLAHFLRRASYNKALEFLEREGR